MKQNILFVEPKAPGPHIFTTFAIPRLGTILLATLAQNRGFTCDVVIEDIRPLSLQDIGKYDLVAISTITPTAPRAYAIADHCRSMGIPTIMGGPHVTFCTDEALEHTDYVIRGEGEDAFVQFLDAFHEGTDMSSIPNLASHNNGITISNPLLPCINDLDRLPHPDFSRITTGMKNINGGTIIPVQTSRGCPFDCTFCSVTAMFGKKYRMYSIDYVLEEIERHTHNRSNFIFFYDDHFTANRKRTVTLLEKMLERNIKLNWSAQVRADLARDPELVRLMKRAGCHTLFIGFESINPNSLEHMQKRQTRDEIERAIRVLKQHKIATHGMFVFGFDDDTSESCKETIRFARKHDIESVQFLILTPFPGTQLHDQLVREGRILFHDWSLYDAHHVTFRPKHFSPFDLQRLQIKGHKNFYSRLRLIKHIALLRINQMIINVYAHKLNRVWKQLNKPYIRLINLLKENKNFTISASIKQTIELDKGEPVRHR
jgi:radical SAM superfamily enzyme YgiQ (UPF0313 family)